MDHQEQLDGWIRKLSKLLPRLAGEQRTAEIVGAWDDYAAQPEVVALLYGPYNAGKSTLLKRLLVEDGTPVPDWLTITGHPETFEVGTIASNGIRYIDTPGSGTANPRHAETIRAALTLTDALVLVLPHKLLTGETEQTLSVLDGGFYDDTHRACFPDHAATVVITQSETMGVDPDDTPELHRARCERKTEELRAQLARAAHATPAVNVHVVSADPNQRVGSAPAPTASDYQEGQGWDRIDALRAELQDLPARCDELRRAAAQRYWAWATGQVLAAADTEIDELHRAAQEAERHNKSLTQLATELDRLDRAQRTALRDAVWDELWACVHKTNARTPHDLDIAIHRALGPRVDSWATQAEVKLQQLADRAKVELTERAKRPSSDHLSECLSAVLESSAAAEGDIAATGSRVLGKLPNSAGWVAENAYRIPLEMPLKEARAELDALRRLKGSEKLAEFFETSKLIGPERAEYVEKIVKQAAVVVSAVPVILELVSIGLAEVGDRVREQADHQRRAQLRADLDAKADQIFEQIVVVVGDGTNNWFRAVEAFRTRLTQLRMDVNAKGLVEQATRLAEYRQQLNDVRAAGLPIASKDSTTLQQMIAAGTARPPAEHGMPELIPDLAPGLESLANLLVADRDKERNR